jgi:hypothetical protein
MARYRPNEEQAAIIEAAGKMQPLAVVAGAGTGKTSTLELLARSYPDRRMAYLAFNRKAADDAQARMPRNVSCKTSHGLTGLYRQYADRVNAGKVPSWKLAKMMGYHTIAIGQERLAPVKVASIVRRTVDRFCYSADHELDQSHVPWVKEWEANDNYALRAQIVPLAALAWQDIMQGGSFPFTHDCYLKIYQLGDPRLPVDVVLLDEAQDTNPCVADIVMRQMDHAQAILVGDPQQAIYEWRGAVNAFDLFNIEDKLFLTGSYRFGPAIAEQANVWLDILNAELRLKGYRKLASEVTTEPIESPTAILCRGNAGVIMEAMGGIEAGKRTAIAGGPWGIASLARAAQSLMAGAATDHPDLIAFQTWEEVRQYVREDREDAGSLAPLVRIVDSYGVEAILKACNSVVDERRGNPELTVSTAHKAKGAEWDHVQVGTDFTPPKAGSEPRTDEMRLSYVTVTRAKLTLGLGSLSWPQDTTSSPAWQAMEDGYQQAAKARAEGDEEPYAHPLPRPVPGPLADAIQEAEWKEV